MGEDEYPASGHHIEGGSRMIYRLCFWVCLVALFAGCGGNGSGTASAPPQAPVQDEPDPDPSPQDTEPGQDQDEIESAPPPLGGGVAMSNPAAANCIDKGGDLESIDTEKGQYGVCVFKDGSRCNQWRLMRGECAPGQCTDEMGKCEKGAKE